MMAYILAIVDVTEQQQYEQYKKLSGQAIRRYGAEVCVRGHTIRVLEGDWSPNRVVMLKFQSPEKALEFYESPEYQTAKAARCGAALMRMVLIGEVQ